MARETKPYSAPVPNRAAGDPRLRTLHLRLLVEIAAHDRMGKNGRGYLLSTRRTAERLCEDYSNVAKAIRDLIGWGYVKQSPHPERAHAQVRMLSIIYTEADREFIEQNRGAREPRNRGAQRPRPHGQTVVKSRRTVVDGPKNSPQNHRLERVEDNPLKRVEDTPLKRTRAGGAPVGIDPLLWTDFRKHRSKLRAPMTERAERGILQRLEEIQAEHGHDPAAVLEQSIRKGWRDVFPLKSDYDGSSRESGRGLFNATRLGDGLFRACQEGGDE